MHVELPLISKSDHASPPQAQLATIETDSVVALWKLLLMTNRKLHMRFRLTPRSMTLDDLELYKFKFSENFADF